MFPLEQGAFEMLLIGAIALIVVGPKDLPVLMRKIGQFTAKMRGMANEFRASFEEMARQSELDELRREVEALRTGQPTSTVGVTGPTVAAQPAIGETEPLASGSSFVSPPHAAPVALSAAASSSPDEPAPSRAAAQGEGGPHDAVVLTAAALAAEPVSEGASGPATGPALGSAAPAVSQTAPKTRSKAARSASDLAAAAQAPAPPGGRRSPGASGAGGTGARGAPLTAFEEADIEASRAPLLSHLAELRSRLIVCAAAVMVGFVGCFFFSQSIYLFLVRPFEMASALSGQTVKPGPFDLILAVSGVIHPVAIHPPTLQATGPLEIFFTKLKLAMFGAVVVTFPVLAWQLYRFVAPGLYRQERRAFLPFLIASPVLFILGASLVYFVMLPFVMWFSLSQQVQSSAVNIVLIPKVSDYLDLVTKLLLAFGLCFQLPVVLSLAGLAGLVQAQQLAAYRKYALLGIIVVSAMVTPPDMISPFLLAGPIYLLYEGSILCVRLLRPKTPGSALTVA